MKNLRIFDIPFVGLKLGTHAFNYQIDSTFFVHFEDAPIKESKLEVNLLFDKRRENFFELQFQIDGTVEAACDRCTAPIQLPIEDDYAMLVKFGNEEQVLEAQEEVDIMYISNGDTIINVAHLVYEYIVLSIPIKKVHPEDEQGNSTCDKKMMDILNQHLLKDEEKKIDPRWEALKKLKDNKNK